MILINNQFPGVSHLKWILRLPTDRFVANVGSELGILSSHCSSILGRSDRVKGDTFSINVHNQITEPKEGTALHW